MQDLLTLLSAKTTLNKTQIKNILSLMKEGSTVPFIARYRKEMTGGATDEQLRYFDEIYTNVKKMIDRRDEIIKLLKEKE